MTPDSISSVAATRSFSVTPDRVSSANTAAASVEPTIAPSSQAVRQSRPTNSTPATAVMPAQIITPTRGQQRGRPQPGAEGRVGGAQAAVEQDHRQRQVADPEAEREVVEAVAAGAVLAGQDAGDQEHQQERKADARRKQARQHAGEDQRRGGEQGRVDEVHRRSIGVDPRSAYFAVGITNSAPLAMLSGQRCITLFCLV